MIDPNSFKIRASAASQIMGGAMNRPTQIQLKRIDELQAKEKLTDRQQEELTGLIEKRDMPAPLSEGAKTYCENWLKEKLFERRKEFSNKYTEKGIECESAGIDLFCKINSVFAVKNEQYFENEYMTGTPDLILPKSVEDIKNSWDVFTFPLFDTELPNKDYYGQMQVYMELTGKEASGVNYCLINAPEELIDKEAKFTSLKAGLLEVDMELWDEVRAKMTYDTIADELKFRRFQVEYESEYILALEHRVRLCREYIKELIGSPSILLATHSDGLTHISAA